MSQPTITVEVQGPRVVVEYPEQGPQGQAAWPTSDGSDLAYSNRFSVGQKSGGVWTWCAKTGTQLLAWIKTYTDTLYAALTHASRHAAAGADPVTPAAIGAYRQAATNAVGNVSGSVTADFATSLTNTYTLTGNCTALPAPTNLADGETGIGLFTLAGFTMPTGPASGCYKGNWTVTGTLVRVVYQRIGALYMVSADSLTVVT